MLGPISNGSTHYNVGSEDIIKSDVRPLIQAIINGSS